MNERIMTLMSLKRPAILLSAVVAAWCSSAHADPAADAEYMRERIRAYHGAAANDPSALRLVYFHPADADPQDGYRERIPRIIEDIQDFYRDGMRSNGYGDMTFSLELDDGKPRLHVVQGKEPSSAYSYASGGKIMREMGKALDGTLDVRGSYVLVFHGLCDRREDGTYRFHAPYYGDASSNHRRGLCHVADCEQLDTMGLTNTALRVKYWEHTGTFDQTLADFNVKYLGGVAHELGHGLSLPHNGQTADERRRLGTALMGSGNHTYRKELQGGRGSFLTFASATRLAAHPLFTGSRRGVDGRGGCRVDELAFRAGEGELVIEGALDGGPEVYAVIAYLDPEGHSDYDALTGVAAVRDGHFKARVPCGKPGTHELRLVACHVNGAVSEICREAVAADEDRELDAEGLGMEWLVYEVEQLVLQGRLPDASDRAGQLLDGLDPSSVPARKLRHLVSLADGEAEPIHLKSVATNEVFLSDAAWASANVGWGRPSRNQYYHDRNLRDALFLEPGETFFEKGLYAHAPSRYVFDLGKRFDRFEGTGGLQQGVSSAGSAVFVVKGDGSELYRSELLKGAATASIDLDIKGVKRLELVVESGKEDNAGCWSVWGAPKVSRAR